jgi:predicted peroxiredoxin
MKKYFFILMILTAFFSSCTTKSSKDIAKMDSHKMMQDTACSTDSSCCDGVFIHISHSYDDPHRVVMPLQMALMMSMDKNVLVYFDIKGIEVVLKNAKDINYPTFKSAQTSLKELISIGVTVFACPGCMKAAGKTADDLIPGVKMAEKEAFFTFTKGRIITLDY